MQKFTILYGMQNSVLKNCGVVPLRMANLYAMLANYNSPRDKISYMEKNGEIIRIKKGLYVGSCGKSEV